MLLRHSFYYGVARGIPGVLSFAAVAIYTRLLSPEDFGRYSLVVVATTLVDVIVFQWQRMVVARFYQQSSERPAELLGNAAGVLLISSACVGVLGLIAAFIWNDAVWHRILAFAVPLIIARGWFELLLTIIRAQLNPRSYGLLSTARSVASIAVGVALAAIGFAADAPIAGLLAGNVIALLCLASMWKGISPHFPSLAILRPQLLYGVPLVVTFALNWVVTGSDRVLINWIVGASAVGVYSASADLANQILGVLGIVNTAATPLAIYAMEKHGPAGARAQLERNGSLVVATAFGAAGMFAVLSPAISMLLVGRVFQEGVSELLPIISMTAAIAGFKSYHLDLAFQIGRRTEFQVLTSLLAAILNVILNLALIPRFGVHGAAWATLVTMVSATVVSARLGRRAFDMPPLAPILRTGAIVGASAAFGGSVMYCFPSYRWQSLAVAALASASAAGIAAILLGVGGIDLRRLLRGLRHKE